jgi:DNA-binding GntR family transcriptional regulator
MARSPAPDVVSGELRRAILDGELEAGAQLKQDEVAEKFGVSRIPVREALKQLAAEGLVTFHPNRGAVVSSLSLEEVLEMLEIRSALECRALRLAIPNMVDEDFDELSGILAEYDEEPSAPKWGEMNWRFHEALYAPCHLPKLLAMIDANYGHVGRFTRTQVSLAAGKERPQREHRQILDACRRGDVDAAVRVLEEHIAHTQKSILAATRGRRALGDRGRAGPTAQMHERKASTERVAPRRNAPGARRR